MYTLIAEFPNHVRRDEDGAVIPFDPDNIDYQEYLAWLDEGNEPTPYTPPEAKVKRNDYPLLRITNSPSLSVGADAVANGERNSTLASI